MNTRDQWPVLAAFARPGDCNDVRTLGCFPTEAEAQAFAATVSGAAWVQVCRPPAHVPAWRGYSAANSSIASDAEEARRIDEACAPAWWDGGILNGGDRRD
jgi:hypothetical protein